MHLYDELYDDEVARLFGYTSEIIVNCQIWNKFKKSFSLVI
jgi:hypothetical protein